MAHRLAELQQTAVPRGAPKIGEAGAPRRFSASGQGTIRVL